MSQEVKSPDSDVEYQKKLDATLSSVHHEDTLMGNRLNWLLTSQTIFFTAYAALLYLDRPPSQAEHKFFFDLIRWIALGTCLLIYLSDLGAVFAIYRFCKWLNEQFPQYTKYSQMRILGPLPTHFLGQASPILLPLGFIGVWLSTLTHNSPWVIVIVCACLIVLASLWRLAFPYPIIIIPSRQRPQEKLKGADVQGKTGNVKDKKSV